MSYSLTGSGFDHAEVQGDHLEGYGYEEDASVSITAPEYTEEDCPACGGAIDEDGDGHEEDCQSPDWKPSGMHLHFNGAGVRIDKEEQRVQVWISVADPRGAFCMNLERTPDGNLRLSVPTPWDSMGHAGLEPLASPGYYAVGGDSNPSKAPGPRELRALVEASRGLVEAEERTGHGGYRTVLADDIEALRAALAPYNVEG